MTNAIAQTSILNRGLPKWPAVLITGKNVTVDQAKDIIFRTDYVMSDCCSVRLPSRIEKDCAHQMGWDLFDEFDYDSREIWRQRMGMISLEYAANHWSSSSYVCGPHGWCNPDGTIHYNNHNWGKWPSLTEVLEDWTKIAAAFPFLELACTLYDKEHSEVGGRPVATFLVADGKVSVVEPDVSYHAPRYGSWDDTTPDDEDWLTTSVAHIKSVMAGNTSALLGWSQDWYLEFCTKSLSIAQQVANRERLLDVKSDTSD